MQSTIEDLVETGKFGIKTNNATYTLYELDSYDEVWVKRHHAQKLKPNEKIFRFRTHRSYEIGKQTPLVKINTEKKIVYFLADNNGDDKHFYFETKGIKTVFLEYKNMSEREKTEQLIESIKKHGYAHTVQLLQSKTAFAKEHNKEVAFNGINRTPHELESLLVYIDDNYLLLSQIKKDNES